jgi:hypothetical protein
MGVAGKMPVQTLYQQLNAVEITAVGAAGHRPHGTATGASTGQTDGLQPPKELSEVLTPQAVQFDITATGQMQCTIGKVVGKIGYRRGLHRRNYPGRQLEPQHQIAGGVLLIDTVNFEGSIVEGRVGHIALSLMHSAKIFLDGQGAAGATLFGRPAALTMLLGSTKVNMGGPLER